MYFLNKMLEHLLGYGKVGDHAVFHRTYRGDVAGSSAQHLFRGEPDFLDHFLAVRAAVLADRDHRRLIEYDTFAAHVNQRVGCAEIDGKIIIEVTAQETKHNY